MNMPQATRMTAPAVFLANRHPRRMRIQGFSLVELMVGMLVAIAAIIVVAQIFQTSEASRRATGGTDDAQNAGSIALTELQADLRPAGQGVVDTNMLMCNLTVNSWTINNLAPVTINSPQIPAGDANTDTLLIAYGGGYGSPGGDLIISQPASNVYSMQVPTSFTQGDMVVATPQTRASTCALTLATVSAAPIAPNVTVNTGALGMSNGILYDLGPNPRVVAYAIRNGNLTSCDYLATDCSTTANGAWGQVASGIVSMRVQYGKDTSSPPDGQLDGYDQTTPTTTSGWSCVLATRLILVAQSSQPEKGPVTQVAPALTAGGTASSAPSVTLTGTNWQNYHYKTFQTVVPMRNVTWQLQQPYSC